MPSPTPELIERSLLTLRFEHHVLKTHCFTEEETLLYARLDCFVRFVKAALHDKNCDRAMFHMEAVVALTDELMVLIRRRELLMVLCSTRGVLENN